MEITEIKAIQKKLKAYHEDENYSVSYEVYLDGNNLIQNISGEVKEIETGNLVGYINKTHELSVRTAYGKENLLLTLSNLAVETLTLLDEVVNNLE